jgi:hypothetical protein
MRGLARRGPGGAAAGSLARAWAAHEPVPRRRCGIAPRPAGAIVPRARRLRGTPRGPMSPPVIGVAPRARRGGWPAEATGLGEGAPPDGGRARPLSAASRGPSTPPNVSELRRPGRRARWRLAHRREPPISDTLPGPSMERAVRLGHRGGPPRELGDAMAPSPWRGSGTCRGRCRARSARRRAGSGTGRRRRDLRSGVVQTPHLPPPARPAPSPLVGFAADAPGGALRRPVRPARGLGGRTAHRRTHGRGQFAGRSAATREAAPHRTDRLCPPGSPGSRIARWSG